MPDNLGVAPVPPPLNPDAADEPLLAYKARHEASRPPLGEPALPREPAEEADDGFRSLEDDGFRALDDGPTDDENRLREIFTAATREGTEQHARVLEVAQKTGLPLDVIQANLPEFTARIQAAEFDPAKFRHENPALADLMLKNPQVAPVVANDSYLAKLEHVFRGMGEFMIGKHIWDPEKTVFKGATSLPEGVKKQFDAGFLQTELSRIAQKQMAGTATPDDLKRGDEIEKEMEAIAQSLPEFGLVAGMLPEAAQQVGRFYQSLPTIGYYTTLGGTTGAGAGALAGGVGALPGALAGAGIGMAFGVFHSTAVDEGAMFYREMIKKNVDPRAAYAGAQIVGLLNGTLEAIPVEKVLRLVPGARALLHGPTRDMMRRLVQNPTVTNALIRAFGRMQEGQALEGLTEGLQEIVSTYEGERVQGASVGSSIAAVWRNRENIGQAALKGYQAAGGMHLASPGVAVEVGTEIAEARRAERRQQFWQALSQAAGQSPTVKSAPQIAASFMEDVVKRYGAPETVGIPAQKLQTLLQAADINVEKIMPDVARQLSDALLGGPETEITVKTSDVATYLAGTAGFEGLSQDIRFGDSPTAREMPEVLKEAEKIKKEMADAEAKGPPPGFQVYEDVRTKLIGAGISPYVASQNAALWQAFVEARASRMGKDPVEYYKGLNLQIGKGELQDLKAKERQSALLQADLERVQRKYPGQDYAVLEHPESPLQLRVYDDTLTPGFHTVSLLGFNEKVGESVKSIKEFGGQGYSTALYLSALADAQAAGVGFASDSIRTDATEKMYARLKKLGVPFEYDQEAERYVVAADKLAKIDVQSLWVGLTSQVRDESKMFSPAEVEALLGGITELRQQSAGGDVRGFFQTNQARDFFRITLTGKANLSTFVHETGHAFLSILQRDALTDAASAAEIDEIAKWLGKKGTGRWTRAQLEQFARGFEAYLWEGKAPSTKLAAVFDHVKSWLRYVYTAITGLNVKLSDEVRNVMDRMLATDIEIDNAKNALGLVPPEDAEGLMTPEEYGKYRATFEAATRAAREQADRRTMREVKREISDEYKQMQAQVAKAATLDKALNAQEVILTGKRLDGAKVPRALLYGDSTKSGKGKLLDRAWVRENMPELAGAQKRQISKLTVDGGMDPEVAGPLLGYADGKELINSLAGVQGLDTWVRNETVRRMSEKYPGFRASKDWVAQTAHSAMHVDAVGNAIWAGMQGMSKKLGGKLGTSAKMAIKEAADQRAAEMMAMQLSTGKVERSEATAAKEAAEAWRGKDPQAAYEAMRKQLFNHYLYRAVEKALDDVTKIREYLNSFGDSAKRERIGKLGEHYLQAIDAILDKINLKKAAKQDVAFALLLAKMRAEGGEPVITPEGFEGLENNYQAMTVAKLRSVQAAVASIEHAAKIAGGYRADLAAADYAETVSALAAHISTNRPGDEAAGAGGGGKDGGGAGGGGEDGGGGKDRRKRLDETWGQYAARLARAGDWHLRKIEFMMRILDGGETAGLAHKLGFQPMADAETREHYMAKELLAKLRPLRKIFSLTERYWHDHDVDFLGSKIKMRNVLAIGLNLRNEGNAERMLQTFAKEGWTKAKVIERLGQLLSAKDIELINKFGDITESYWGELSQVYQRTTGVAPQKVTGEDVVLANGTIKGGYYPVIKDFDKAHIQADPNELWDPQFIPVDPEHGFVESRSDGAKTPIKLSIDALPHHLMSVIHYITHYEAVRNVDRLFRAPAVRDAIVKGLSAQAYDQIRPWLLSIAQATDSGMEPMALQEKILRHTRIGAGIVLLNLKTATGVKQMIGLTNTVKEIGFKYTAYGVRHFLADLAAWVSGRGGNPLKTASVISPTYELHRENFDREVHAAYKASTSLFAAFGAIRPGIQTMGMALFNLFQGTVNTITWWGAHQQALDEGHERPEDYANAKVRMSQAGGGLKDLAAWQRGSEFKKLWSVMYSYYSVLYNQFMEETPAEAGRLQKIGILAARYWWLALLPSMISVAMRGGDDDLPEKAKAAGLESLTFGARSIPMVDQATNALVTGRPARMAPWLDTMYGALQAGHSAAVGDDLTDREVKYLINALGMITQLPTGGAMNGAEFLGAYLDGELQEPIQDLLFRSPKEAR